MRNYAYDRRYDRKRTRDPEKLREYRNRHDKKRGKVLRAEQARVRRFLKRGRTEPDGTYWGPEYRPLPDEPGKYIPTD